LNVLIHKVILVKYIPYLLTGKLIIKIIITPYWILVNQKIELKCKVHSYECKRYLRKLPDIKWKTKSNGWTTPLSSGAVNKYCNIIIVWTHIMIKRVKVVDKTIRINCKNNTYMWIK